MTGRATSQDATGRAGDVEAVASAGLTASRLLVAIAARSLGVTEERVTLPQFRMLVVLASHGDTTLAERLAVNPGTDMRTVDRLTSSGLVARRASPANRREIAARLTRQGRQIVEDVTAYRREEIAAIVARMPEEHRTGLVDARRAFADADAGGRRTRARRDPPRPGTRRTRPDSHLTVI